VLYLLCTFFFLCVDHFPLPSHLHDAWSLIRHTAPANTLYRHRPTTIVFPDTTQPTVIPTCHADCSGLTNALLAHAYDLNDAQLSTLLHAKRPLARHYYSAILEQRGFARILRATDITPGDLLAIRYEPGASNTGHIMVAASRAIWRQVPARRTSSTTPTYAWHVLIIDSSSGNRGTGDLRYPGIDPQTGKLLPQTLTGLGIGWHTLPTIGAPAPSQFPTSDNLISPEVNTTPKRPLVIGRLNPAAFRTAQPLRTPSDDTSESQHD